MTLSISALGTPWRVPVQRCIGALCITRMKQVLLKDIQRVYTDAKGRIIVRAAGIDKSIILTGTTIADLADQAESMGVALFEHPKKKNSLFNPARQENLALLEKWQKKQNPACVLL